MIAQIVREMLETLEGNLIGMPSEFSPQFARYPFHVCDIIFQGGWRKLKIYLSHEGLERGNGQLGPFRWNALRFLACPFCPFTSDNLFFLYS